MQYSPKDTLIAVKLDHLAEDNPHMAPQPTFLSVKKAMLAGSTPETPETPEATGDPDVSLAADSPGDQLRAIADCLADGATIHAEQLRELAAHIDRTASD